MAGLFFRLPCLSTATTALALAAMLAVGAGGGAAAALEFPPITAAEQALSSVPGQPNAPAVVLFHTGVVHMMDPAARQEVYSYLQVQVRVKILTDAGKSRGNVQIAHSGSYRLQDFEGRTVLANGTVVPLPKDAQFQSTNSRLHKVLITKVAFPSVEVGAIVDYHYTIKWDSFLFLDPWIFQEHIPVLHSEIVYEIPATLGVTGWRNDPMQVGIHSETVAVKGAKHLRAWADNLPAVPEEAFSLPFSDMAAEEIVLPTELGHPGRPMQPLFKDWASTCEQLDHIYDPVKRQDGEAGHQARELAARMATPPAGTSRERGEAQAVYAFVRDEITTEYSSRILVPKDATIGAALARRRGTPAEKALLLQAMLAALKIDSRLVWAANREDGGISLDVPNPLWFDRMMVAAIVDGQRVFLDPSDRALCFGHLEAGYEGTRAVLFDRAHPEIVTLPETAFDANLRHVQLDLTFDDTGRATGTGTLTLRGHPARERTRWKGAFATAEEAWADRLRKDFPAFDISAVTVAESLDDPQVSVSWALSQHPEEALGDQATLVVSRPLGPVRQLFPLGAKRLSPIAFPFAGRDEIDLTVHWAEGWRPEVLPLAAGYETFAGAMVAKVDVDAAHRTLAYHRRFDRAHWKTVTADQFRLTQQLYEEAQKVDAQSLVLARR